MLKLLPDETLHSFIVRYSMLYGIDLKKVITPKNFYSQLPKLNANYADAFDFLSDKQKATLVLHIDSDLQDYKNTIYHSGIPFYAQMLANNLFFKGKISNLKKPENQIAYCPKCLKKMMKEQGFVYLKNRWLYLRKCRKHDEKIRILLFYSNDLREIKHLFNCEFNRIEFSFNHVPRKINTRREEPLFMPCTKNVLMVHALRFLLKNRDYNDLREFERYVALIDGIGMCNVIATFQRLISIVQKIQKIDKDYFNNTVSKELNLKEIHCKFNNYGFYKERLYTAKNMNCSTCTIKVNWNKYCVNSLVVCSAKIGL